MTGYKKRHMTPDSAIKQQSLLLWSLQSTGDKCSLLPIVLLWANKPMVTNNSLSYWWQSDTKPVCMQTADLTLTPPSPTSVCKLGIPHHRPSALAGSALHYSEAHFLLFGISPWEPTFIPEQVSVKISLQATRKRTTCWLFPEMYKGNRGCLKEAEFCNWEKEIGEINVSVYPLYFCLPWVPFGDSNYLK